MPRVARSNALLTVAVVLGVALVYTSDGFAGLAFTAFLLLAAVAWIPRLGASVLARVGWRRLPYLGGLTGLAASLVLLVLAFGSVTVSPSVRMATPRPSAAVNAVASSASTGSGIAVPAAAPRSPSTAPTRTMAMPGPGACSGHDPSTNVYHPDRLVLFDPCVTLTGTVALTRREADGDWHISLRLDAGQERYVNDKNRTELGGALIVEIICANPISQTDAVDACRDYTNFIPVPRVGAHVSVTGPWVLDTAHGWNEVHPVWALLEDRATTTATPTATTNVAPRSSSDAAPLASAVPTATEAPVPASAAPTAPAPTAVPVSTMPADWGVAITASRYGYVSATTTQGTICTAQARLPSGNISSAQGLQPSVTASSGGAVSWTYRTVSTTTPGTGTHTVTCTLNGATRSASAPFTVP